MTAKHPNPAASGAERGATRLGLGPATPEPPFSSDGVFQGRASAVRARESGVSETSRRGFSFRLPPVAPVEAEVGALEPRAVMVAKTQSARVFLKPGELPEWMGAATEGAHPRKSGTFPTGEASEWEEESVVADEPGVPPIGEAAPLTAAPPPPPFRRPMAKPRAVRPTVESIRPSALAQPPRESAGRRAPLPSFGSSRAAHRVRSVVEGVLRARVLEVDFASLIQGWAPRLVGVLLGGVALGAVAYLPIGGESEAAGVLRSSHEARIVTATSSGAVVGLLVEPGAEVRADQPLVRLESLQLDANAARRRRELTELRADLAESNREGGELLERRQQLLTERSRLLQYRLRLKQDEMVNRRRRVNEAQRQFDEGEVSLVQLSDARAALQATQEGKLRVDTEIAQVELEQSERQQAELRRKRQRRLDLASAEASARDAERLLALSVVRAPTAGWVEGITVAPGAVVQSGTAIATIVPLEAPTRIVAYAPIEKVAALREGDEGRVMFHSLSGGEAPELDARIVRIAQKAALPSEVEAMLGQVVARSVLRLELELLDDPEYYRIQDKLGLGTPVVVRLNTADHRLVDAAWAKVQSWFVE